MPPKKKDPEVRFLNNVETNKEGCWIWQLYISNAGYGFFRPSTRSVDPQNRQRGKSLQRLPRVEGGKQSSLI